MMNDEYAGGVIFIIHHLNLMTLEFEGRVAVVTGGASGIGQACAWELARAGADLVVVDAAAEAQLAQVENLLKAAGGRVVSFRADVREHARAARVVEETLQRLGRLDLLVNAAGTTADAPLWEMSEEQWQVVLDTNLKGAFSYTQAAARHFRRVRGGRIVNVASIELGRYGVCINAVSPGFIRTPLAERLPEAVRERAARESALGRMGEPEDVAHAVLFLCSPRARHITGAVLNVDGGQSL